MVSRWGGGGGEDDFGDDGQVGGEGNRAVSERVEAGVGRAGRVAGFLLHFWPGHGVVVGVEKCVLVHIVVMIEAV